MNGTTQRPTSNGVKTEALANRPNDPVEYVGFRVDGQAVVLNLSEHRRLSPERSFDAFALDGTRQWQTTTDIAIGGTVEALARAGEVLVAASDNALAAYDPASGMRRWQYDPEYRIGVTATERALYVAARDSGGIARLPTR